MEQSEYKPDSVFLDKIRLSAIIVDKEGQLTGSFSNLVRKLRCGLANPDNLRDSTDFANSWSLLDELFNFMLHNEILKHKRNSAHEYEEIIQIFETYEGSTGHDMSYKDLRRAKYIITKIISGAGYHDTSFRKEDDFDSEED